MGKAKRLVFGTLLLCALVFAVRHLALPSCAEVEADVQSAGLPLASLVYVLAYVVATVAFVPGTVITLLAGLAFGPWLGTVLVTVGANLGALAAFLASRYVAREAIEARLSRQAWFTRFKGSLQENGLSFVLFVRLVPVFPFNGLNYAAGLVPLKLRDYAVGSFVGMLPGTFAYVYLGNAGCSAVESIASGHLPPEVRTKLLIAVGLLAALSLLPLAFKRRRGKAASSSPVPPPSGSGG